MKKPSPRKRAPRKRPTGDKHAIPAGEAGTPFTDYVVEKPKHAGGRPTKYDPAFCDQVVEFGAEGFSLGAFAGLIGVCKQTINTWRDEYPEFLAATICAKAARLLKWERIALRNAQDSAAGSATMTQFALKNIDKDEWQDVSRHEQTGPNGAPISLHLTKIERVIVYPNQIAPVQAVERLIVEPPKG